MGWARKLKFSYVKHSVIFVLDLISVSVFVSVLIFHISFVFVFVFGSIFVFVTVFVNEINVSPF